MSTYVVGDLQGCLTPLQRLLEQLRFDPARDLLVCAGDMVARGPDSLGTLRFLRSLGPACAAVLGNHDLHLIAQAHGIGRIKPDFQTLLDAADAAELLETLIQRPLAWSDPASNTLVVHAGLAPQWRAQDALRHAEQAQAVLRDPVQLQAFLPEMYGDTPDRWQDDLTGSARIRTIINILTRSRYCFADGRLDFTQKGTPGSQPATLQPWFTLPQRRSLETRIVFGHWSTLGRVQWPRFNVCGLDTGCVWGGALTALRLEDGRVFQNPSQTPALVSTRP
ncbi:symmetrical bis(5'-nucleosyl)-tetraphosphatase [Sinimarinibacterium sp. NLF-5-8]|uniref:symmetrical bis(5'-nucleosyl)-tetraphosphatase n=1 Tax=Sinimarinibacterium sp. NLF-5-8 TaxID=2698684 RepID=UPI00137BC98B|nr:symmetrical bis(5'-nucleosyl)-tetraphosphatase [Sinimarinibacterium sp. NLF-5-8]QHS11250.1 symmetrical bis(5'-nucleosyl)-tetraphosphatase [Sinimarinibacterium sp. NLF-5-8]